MTNKTMAKTSTAREKTGAQENRREKKALTGAELVEFVEQLEATGDFRVLKRLVAATAPARTIPFRTALRDHTPSLSEQREE